jgi:hypothetical protein
MRQFCNYQKVQCGILLSTVPHNLPPPAKQNAFFLIVFCVFAQLNSIHKFYSQLQKVAILFIPSPNMPFIYRNVTFLLE